MSQGGNKRTWVPWTTRDTLKGVHNTRINEADLIFIFQFFLCKHLHLRLACENHFSLSFLGFVVHEIWSCRHFFIGFDFNWSSLYGSVFQPFRKSLRCPWNTMQWSKCLYCYKLIELWLRISSQAFTVCFGRTPGSHLRNPEVPRNSGWKILLYSNFKSWTVRVFNAPLTFVSE